MSPMTHRSLRIAASGCLALLGTALAAQTVRAQQLVLKRWTPSDSAQLCPPLPKPVIPSWSQREQARRLMVVGHEAAITGDYAAARDRFKQAAQLDPTDENIAYELARAYEGTKDTADAAREYCRYLSLAPQSSEASDVRAHITALGVHRDPTIPAQAVARFRTGVDQFDRRQWSAAERAFSAATALAPGWADPYYDRALARAAAGDSRRAAEDFDRYLRLAPNAADRSAVTARIAALRRGLLDPSVALASGLLPGAGQFYTHRPVLGLAVLGATAGALYWGLRPQHVTITRTFKDPNDVSHSYTLEGTQRTHLTAGVAAASAITLLGALEAYIYARHETAPATGDDVRGGVRPTAGAFTALPTLTPAGMGLGLTVHFPLRLH